MTENSASIGPEAASGDVDKRRTSRDRRTDSYAASMAAVAGAAFDERRLGPDRRKNAIQRWERVVLGGLPVVVADRAETAHVIVDEALRRHGHWRYPAYLTSTNGEVTYECAVDRDLRQLFLEADALHADGAAHVFASRLHGGPALPERVATSDLFHDIAALSERTGATMYMLGATKGANAAAVRRVRAQYPNLRIVGHRHGFFADEAEEIAVCDEIARLGPDILWISMGVPREQTFAVKHRHRLTSVGAIKTSGGLFDFLSGEKRRAPLWLQTLGFEWLWRVCLEPRRLAWRYIKTNPLALYLLLTRQRIT